MAPAAKSPSTSESSFSEYRRLILQQLEDHEREIKDNREKLITLRLEAETKARAEATVLLAAIDEAVADCQGHGEVRSLSDRVTEAEKKVVDQALEIVALKEKLSVRAGVWGAVAGLLGALAVALMAMYLGGGK